MPRFPTEAPPATLPRPSAQELASSIRFIAKEIGFDACQFARAQPAKHANSFTEFLEEQRAGEMHWLERQPERRTDPTQVLPNCKTVIVLGISYAQIKSAPERTTSPPKQQHKPATGAPTTQGIIARYAQGEDYHRYVEEKLTDLVHALENWGALSRPYVDTGPVLERNWASESGLGWGGKSTVQIDRNLGTWFFLATILTTLEIAPDKPQKDRCGSCTRCIAACPTNAIIAPRKLDPRRCISYLTIEHPSSIPLEFRKAIGARIFGCDDCLAACPWNRFAKQSRHLKLAPRPHWQQLSLTEMLELGEENYKQLVRRSAMARTKWPRFARNVCVALGNVGTEADLPALEKAAQSDDSLISEHALWAISQIQARHQPTH